MFLLLCRADGVFGESMNATKQLLSKSWDSEIALMFASILLCFSQDAAGQAVLACKEGTRLLAFLLQVNAPSSSQMPLSARIVKICRFGSLEDFLVWIKWRAIPSQAKPYDQPVRSSHNVLELQLYLSGNHWELFIIASLGKVGSLLLDGSRN